MIIINVSLSSKSAYYSYLYNHATLKTGVTAAENTVLQSQNNMIFFCKSCNKEGVVD